MSYFVILILIVLTTTGIVGQNISFNFQRLTTCNDSLLAGKDKYLIDGTAGPVPALEAAGWETSVHFGVFTSTSQYVEICAMNIGRTGAFCQPPHTPPCYCDRFDASTGVGHILVNYTARLVDSQQNLLFMWQHTNKTRVYSSQNISLPGIYDVNAAVLELTVNGNPANVENGGSCGSSFTASGANTLRLCCTNTAKPCYPRIALDGKIVADNQPECVNYTFTTLSDNYTVIITKSYSVCTQSDYITKGICVMNTSLATTTAPTTTTGVESPTLTTPSSPTDNGTNLPKVSVYKQNLGLKLGIPVGSFTIVIIVTIVVCRCKDKNATLVCCCCCTEKGVSIYCCCYNGKIVSTSWCSCNPLNNGGNDGNVEPPATGGAMGPGPVILENTGDVSKNGRTKVDPNVDVPPHSAKRSKNATGGSELQIVEVKDIKTKNATGGSELQIVEVKDIKTKNATGGSELQIVEMKDIKTKKNATGGSELQIVEVKDIQTKKNEAPTSKTGPTSAKGPRYNSQRPPSSS